MFGSLSGVLLSSDVLQAGKTYTFSFQSSQWFFFSEDLIWMKNSLAERMANFGEIVSVLRPMSSDRYIVTVVPSVDVSLSNWIDVFDSSWKDMGWDSWYVGYITFVSAESGAVSTQPGGIPQTIQQTGQEILAPLGGALASGLKPLLPYMLGFFGIYLLITMSPMLLSKRKGA